MASSRFRKSTLGDIVTIIVGSIIFALFDPKRVQHKVVQRTEKLFGLVRGGLASRVSSRD